ncbi:hypothetical protein FBQ95_17245 [Chloroflexi bacterium CFX3]|nr:hypothetical protein [Chloroflexi bacterium CFX3]
MSSDNFPVITTFKQVQEAVYAYLQRKAAEMLIADPRMNVSKALQIAASVFRTRFVGECLRDEAPEIEGDPEGLVDAMLAEVLAEPTITPKPEPVEAADNEALPAPESNVLKAVTRRGRLYVIRYAPTPLVAKPLRVQVMQVAESAGNYVAFTKEQMPFAERCWRAGLLDRHTENAKQYQINDAGRAWLRENGS